MNAWEVATDEQKHDLAELFNAWKRATDAREANEVKKRQIQEDMRHAESRTGPGEMAAFAAYGGDRPVSAVPVGPSEEELKKLLKGAEWTIARDKEDETVALGALKAGVHAVVRDYANRQASIYVAASKTQDAAWAAIAGAQEFLTSVHGEDIVDKNQWRTYNVPGSKNLPNLTAASADEGHGFHMRTMATGEKYDARAAAQATAIERAITPTIGCWPFGRGATPANAAYLIAGASQAAAAREEASRSSRRAAIARAAQGMEFPHASEE